MIFPFVEMTSQQPRRRIAAIPITETAVEPAPTPSLPLPIASSSTAPIQLGPTRRIRISLNPIINDDDPFNIIDLREVRSVTLDQHSAWLPR